MGYPRDVLSTRAIIRHGAMALIPPEGLVNNVVPGIEKCRVSIVASPKMGASFVQYIVTAEPGGGTSKKYGAEKGIECFLYCLEGEGEGKVGGQETKLTEGQYMFAPDGVGLEFKNTGSQEMKLILYKQRYIPLEGYEARVVINNISNLEAKIYDGMSDVHLTDLLPTDLGFDMNFHILTFQPGASHPFIETHVQEHGAYLTSGEGAYFIDNEWITVKKGDFMWFGPYTTQGAYGIGREPLSYVYSKDCNRDPEI